MIAQACPPLISLYVAFSTAGERYPVPQVCGQTCHDLAPILSMYLERALLPKDSKPQNFVPGSGPAKAAECTLVLGLLY